MRKVLLFTLAASLIFTISGCLKDKGFEKQQYGIQVVEVKAVAFPQSTSSPIVIGINSQATTQTVDGPTITTEQDGVVTSPVTVTIAINNTLVTDAGLTLFPVGGYSVNSLTVTIPAGEKFSSFLKVTIPNSSSLDATKSYGIGLTISAVDQGYKIASNFKNVVLQFNIKNKYDGKYNLKGIHNRAPYDQYPFNLTVGMVTTGPSSVAMYLYAPFGDFAQPIGTAVGVVGWYGNVMSPNFTFNPNGTGPGGSDLCTGVTTYVGAGVTLAMVTTGGIVNRYEPGPKKMYLTYQYNGNDLRRFYDTLTYIGPR